MHIKSLAMTGLLRAECSAEVIICTGHSERESWDFCGTLGMEGFGYGSQGSASLCHRRPVCLHLALFPPCLHHVPQSSWRLSCGLRCHPWLGWRRRLLHLRLLVDHTMILLLIFVWQLTPLALHSLLGLRQGLLLLIRLLLHKSRCQIGRTPQQDRRLEQRPLRQTLCRPLAHCGGGPSTLARGHYLGRLLNLPHFSRIINRPQSGSGGGTAPAVGREATSLFVAAAIASRGRCHRPQ